MLLALITFVACSATTPGIGRVRLGASMIVRGSTMYSFGGSQGVNASDEITTINIRDGRVRRLPVIGQRPLGRMFHSAFYQANSDQMFVVSLSHMCLSYNIPYFFACS